VFLVAGGDADPNIETLIDHLKRRDVEYTAVLVGNEEHAQLTWDVEADRLVVDGTELRPTAAFLRRDVFTNLADNDPKSARRATIWHTTLQGWIMAHDVPIINANSVSPVNKPFQLSLALECGLRIPETLISNDLQMLEDLPDAGERVAKPVPGGGYCQKLDGVLETTTRRNGNAPGPAIVQERLVAPEIRVYGIGDRRFAFRMDSEALDYRAADDTEVVPIPVDDVPDDILAGFDRVMNRLRMDYAAADFKTSPEDGELRFLEINSSPMFAGFDAARHRRGLQDEGTISDALIDMLTQRAAAPTTA
jgi:hypothetical protein